MNKALKLAITTAIAAGKDIISVYEQPDLQVEVKADSSPLTMADKKSHEAIVEGLENFGLPILSEEGKTIAFDDRSQWGAFWLVDPLDGTKEFIKRNGEFTVNIALVENGEPVLGVVYVPVLGTLYYGSSSAGSYKVEYPVTSTDDIFAVIEASAVALTNLEYPAKYTIVASRSHNTPETEAFVKEKEVKEGEIDLISAGSSIKLCLVAERKAHVYPRLAPTMEWDTAAGHAVAKFAGCKVYNSETGNELVYNKENLLNPWFVVDSEA
jgi:3'(2'), 5'-bisphosphate nucleotidase